MEALLGKIRQALFTGQKSLVKEDGQLAFEQLLREIERMKDENSRLRIVVAVADTWRQTLDLPQQDLGCEEFNEAFADYDTARDGVKDLIPLRESSFG